MLARNGVPVFRSSSTRFWTPHSGRTLLPSATAALGFSKSERDFLGGWCAQASDRYARIAIRRNHKHATFIHHCVCKVRLWILLQKTNRSVILALHGISKPGCISKNSLFQVSGFCQAVRNASQPGRTHSHDSRRTRRWHHSRRHRRSISSQQAIDAKVTQKLAQRLWERIPKKPETALRSQTGNLVTTFAFQVKRRSKHSISWASVIFFQALTILTIPTTESLFREFLPTIAFVDYALVKELKMAETLRAQGPPQVRLLMASDWPSDVQVPSKRVLCASAQQKRFATTLFASVSRTHFSLSGNPQIFFYWWFFFLVRCSCLLCFCLRGLGVPGFALFLSGRWVVPCLLCLGLPSRACVVPVFWDFSQDT